jgi:Transglutaminase-like superfamily
MAPSRWNLRLLLRRLTGPPGPRIALLLEATLRLLLARVVLVLIPFRTLARWLGTFVPPTDLRVAQAKSRSCAGHAALAREIGWAVTTAARYAPFRAVCLPQAIAARMMLMRRGVPSVIHFGALKDGDGLDTHAWLDAAGIEVTGFPVSRRFVEIACFV